MAKPVSNKVIRTDTRIQRAIDAREKDGPSGAVSFQSTAQRWRTGTKAVVGALSVVSGGMVPLGLWLGGAFKRRLVVQPQGAQAGRRGVKTRLSASKWQKLQAEAARMPGRFEGVARPGNKEDEKLVRTLSMRVIKAAAGTNKEYLEHLHAGLEKMSTTDLARTARLVASGKVGVLEDIVQVQKGVQQDAVSHQLRLDVNAYRANAARFEKKLGDIELPRAPSSDPKGGPDPLREVPQTDEQAALRELAADLLYARTSADMHQEDDQAKRIRDLLIRHADTLALLARDPDAATRAGLPESVADMVSQQADEFVLLAKDSETARKAGLPQPVADRLEKASPRELKEAMRSQLRNTDPKVLAANIKEGLKVLPLDAYRKVNELIDDAVVKLDFNKIGAQDGQSGPLASIDFPGMESSGLGQFFKQVFTNYFNEQTTLDKRAMLASCLRQSTANDSPERQLLGLIKGTGPYMLKVLQLLGDHAPPDLKKVLGAVKSNLTPLDATTRKALLFKMTEDINADSANPYRVRRIGEARVLGAASVGEAISADLELVPRDPAKADQYPERKERVVIKLLRPGVELRAARDRAFFMKVAEDVQQGMPDTIKGIAKQIDAELDLRNEARYVEEGACYTQETHRNVQAMRLAGVAAPANDYMLIKRAPGSTVDRYLKLLGECKEGTRPPNFDAVEIGARLDKALGNLSDVWLQEMLFGSGFFHGDLHSGNMMFDGDSGQLTVIDFGNAGRLNKQEQRAILLMGTCARARLSRVFAREFENLLSAEARAKLDQPYPNSNRTNREVLGEKIRAIIKETDIPPNADKATRDVMRSPASKINRVLMEAQLLGLPIPENLANVSRSLLMLETTMKSVNEQNQRIKEDELAGIDREFNEKGEQIEKLEQETFAKAEALIDQERAKMIETQLKAEQPIPENILEMGSDALKKFLAGLPPGQSYRLIAIGYKGSNEDIHTVLFPDEMRQLKELRSDQDRLEADFNKVKATRFAQSNIGDAMSSAGERNWFRAINMAPKDMLHSISRIMRGNQATSPSREGQAPVDPQPQPPGSDAPSNSAPPDYASLPAGSVTLQPGQPPASALVGEGLVQPLDQEEQEEVRELERILSGELPQEEIGLPPDDPNQGGNPIFTDQEQVQQNRNSEPFMDSQDRSFRDSMTSETELPLVVRARQVFSRPLVSKLKNE